MTVSVLDLFRIGIGPSSSHTVGPMRAARQFIAGVDDELLMTCDGLGVSLYGSLAATGHGHGTFPAVLLGLEGHDPETISPEVVDRRRAEFEDGASVILAGIRPMPFSIEDIERRPLTVLPGHTNGMRFTLTRDGQLVADETWYSIGGGFVHREGEPALPPSTGATAPNPFRTAAELLEHCERDSIAISDVMLANELVNHSRGEIEERLLEIARAMQDSATAGMGRSGMLPGTLKVRRRARAWHERLLAEPHHEGAEFWQEWVNLIALAVNEENASGGRVVTAPTNGAAGIVPAVLHYALTFARDRWRYPTSDETTVRFLLTAGAIGCLYKEQASISGAEMGCQGEVGSASSMAAAGLAEVMGGTPRQVENAAEIAMEHNLGLTCDPVGGLVQIPCIERNAIAAGKAINAAKMALWGDGDHRVSLDEVIATMRETGLDMNTKYKETALGGLAVNVVEC